MQVSHTPTALSAAFDEPNLIAAAGLVPVMELARDSGLHELADRQLSVPTDKGANAGAKTAALVAGMAAGADSIDDMTVLRHGGMKRLFGSCYAPSTLGSFLRSFSFGHVRQLDAVASRFLGNLANRAPLLGDPGAEEFVFVDVDDTIIEVHGYAKQGSGYGYSGVRGLNAVLAIASTADTAPVILAQRLRKGAANSARGAKRLVADSLATLGRIHAESPVLCRFDSAYYGHAVISTALAGGADVSVTARMDSAVKRAISGIEEAAWESIEYTDAIFDETAGAWISKAEVAEIDFTAFSSRKKADRVPGRLVVRRIPELNPKATDGQPTLFDAHRFHAFFTTVSMDAMGTVVMDKTHRRHAVIEQVNADLKNSALAHLPSGHFGANSAWLAAAVMAYNLTRTAGVLAAGRFRKARTATIRDKLVNVPARIASSARRIRLHLPEAWPWQQAWEKLFAAVHAPPQRV
ncbi:IS1380 family transposase [Arthrobacter rhombi]|uniref:IS1380 family transposase n=1 Tax=Arthrobacter rhombi TaxID=71253 RepID=UPI003FD4DCFD